MYCNTDTVIKQVHALACQSKAQQGMNFWCRDGVTPIGNLEIKQNDDESAGVMESDSDSEDDYLTLD